MPNGVFAGRAGARVLSRGGGARNRLRDSKNVCHFSLSNMSLAALFLGLSHQHSSLESTRNCRTSAGIPRQIVALDRYVLSPPRPPPPAHLLPASLPNECPKRPQEGPEGGLPVFQTHTNAHAHSNSLSQRRRPRVCLATRIPISSYPPPFPPFPTRAPARFVYSKLCARPQHTSTTHHDARIHSHL